jgi:hypothetical protein
MTPELMELDQHLTRLYPYSRDYYRVRAQKARRRREMTERLAASVPYVSSAACQA